MPGPVWFTDGVVASKQVGLRWQKSSGPVLACNQFMASLSVPADAGRGMPTGVLMTLGYLAPPSLLGSEEEQIAQANQIDVLEIEPLGRFSIPLEHVVELRDALNQILDRVDRARAERDREQV